MRDFRSQIERDKFSTGLDPGRDAFRNSSFLMFPQLMDAFKVASWIPTLASPEVC